ncbi:MAG: hypothetical protein ACLFWL_19055 [Candidatus Brocadiia bacterium]
MKFAVGYQLAGDNQESFVDVVRDYAGDIEEVYFPWVNAASGRAMLGTRNGYVDWTAQERLEADLKEFRIMGMKLDLLFNANCYGQRAISRHLQAEVASVLEHLQDVVGGADVVTTTSPAIGHTVQQYFPEVEVRASVNMRIGTVEAMGYVGDLFDSFYLQRDYQRDVRYVREVKDWCVQYGKDLLILANSGCLRLCPGQIFHDNMVAHDAGIDEMDKVDDFLPHVCWREYRDRSNWPSILQATWIRPEDLHHYEGVINTVKLATRMHDRPRAVLDAYTARQWQGNLLNLFEPSFSTAFAPYFIENGRFPDDWFAHTSTCDRRCHRCDYCDQVLENVLVKGDV